MVVGQDAGVIDRPTRKYAVADSDRVVEELSLRNVGDEIFGTARVEHDLDEIALIFDGLDFAGYCNRVGGRRAAEGRQLDVIAAYPNCDLVLCFVANTRCQRL